MKAIQLLLVAIISISFSSNISAQTTNHSNMNMKTEVSTSKTEVFKVSGNCESCKSRIEKAAKVEGVIKVVWSMKTKMLTVVYDSVKVKPDEIQKIIAAVGHDTPKYKATDKVYNTLPSCCKYRQ